jgi:hypothetical protein
LLYSSSFAALQCNKKIDADCNIGLLDGRDLCHASLPQMGRYTNARAQYRNQLNACSGALNAAQITSFLRLSATSSRASPTTLACSINLMMRASACSKLVMAFVPQFFERRDSG